MEEALTVWGMAMITGVAIWALRAANRHWEREHQRLMGTKGVEALTGRVAMLERRIEASAAFDDRLSDLEERQDFAERLLTQATRDQLPGPSH